MTDQARKLNSLHRQLLMLAASVDALAEETLTDERHAVFISRTKELFAAYEADAKARTRAGRFKKLLG